MPYHTLYLTIIAIRISSSDVTGRLQPCSDTLRRTTAAIGIVVTVTVYIIPQRGDRVSGGVLGKTASAAYARLQFKNIDALRGT